MNVEDLLHELDFEIKPDSNVYQYNGIYVPRVSEILSATIHEEYLLKWANSLGYKHINYLNKLNESANIGTETHKCIEEFLNSGIKSDLIPFNSFIKWWEIITNNKTNVLATEQSLVCRWFGGTYDLLLEINDKIYLIDFKTSNRISYKYWIQLSAYRYMLYNTKGINIDGCIILHLDKNTPSFDEYILHFDDIDHLNFINRCTDTFFSMVYQYYNIKQIKEFKI